MCAHDYRSVCAHVACIHGMCTTVCASQKNMSTCEEHVRMCMCWFHSLFALLEQREQDDPAFQDQGIVEI